MMPKAKSVRRPAGESQPQPHLDSQPSQPGSSLSSDTDEQIDVVDSQICIKTLHADLVRLTKTVAELKETVRKQQTVINQLQLTTGNEVRVIDNEVMIDTVPNISGPSFPSLQTVTAVTGSYAAAAANRPVLTDSVRQAVLTAVHSEMNIKQSRNRNIVISGLQRSNTTQDKDLVSKLLFDELGFLDVRIIQCKRLGKSLTTSEGRPQPLRVIFQSVEEARDILASARSLRHSTDHHIHANVFISPDLTRAEAEAAYNARCARRRARQVRQVNTTTPRPSVMSSFPSTSQQSPSVMSRGSRQPAAEVSTLQPSAPDFNPVSHSSRHVADSAVPAAHFVPSVSTNASTQIPTTVLTSTATTPASATSMGMDLGSCTGQSSQ